MQQFIHVMAYTLRKWDNHVLDQKYYNAMAWSGGMVNTSAFDELDPDFQDLILEVLENEGNAAQEANEDAKGTTNCD